MSCGPAESTPKNSGAATPTTVNGTSSIRIDWPSAAGFSMNAAERTHNPAPPPRAPNGRRPHRSSARAAECQSRKILAGEYRPISEYPPAANQQTELPRVEEGKRREHRAVRMQQLVGRMEFSRCCIRASVPSMASRSCAHDRRMILTVPVERHQRFRFATGSARIRIASMKL